MACAGCGDNRWTTSSKRRPINLPGGTDDRQRRPYTSVDLSGDHTHVEESSNFIVGITVFLQQLLRVLSQTRCRQIGLGLVRKLSIHLERRTQFDNVADARIRQFMDQAGRLQVFIFEQVLQAVNRR